MLPDPRPFFADLTEPRRETNNKLHQLTAIIVLVFCAVLSGIEDWVGMERKTKLVSQDALLSTMITGLN